MAIYVLHHEDDDGYVAGAIASSIFDNEATYIPVQYGQSFPDIELTDKDSVYILDFSYSREILDAVYSKVRYLIVLEHHETANENLLDAPYLHYDITKSGALLAWEYFYKDTAVPDVVKYADDYDLWTHRYRESKALNLGMEGLGWDKKLIQWRMLLNNSSALADVIKRGMVLLTAKERKIELFVSEGNKYQVVRMPNYTAAIYNTTTDINLLAEALCNSDLGIDFTISYFITKDAEMVFSLRSKKGSNVDVSALAKSMGGGGRKTTAGCRMSLQKGIAYLDTLYNS